MVYVMPCTGIVELNSPFSGGIAVNIGGGDHVFTQPTRAIWVGTGGAVNLTVQMLDGTDLVFANVASGTLLLIRCTAVRQTGTGTTNMVALW